MIDPIILWVGGIVILLACVLFYLLIAELLRQHPVRASHPRLRGISLNFNTRTYTLFFVLAVLIRSLIQGLMLYGVGVFQTYLITFFPVVFMVLWMLYQDATHPYQHHSPQDNYLRELQSRLFNMTGGDKNLAFRLVDYERCHIRPGKGETSYWEAAIDRLARDRC